MAIKTGTGSVRWIVRGADRDTGEDRSMTLSAESEHAARVAAQLMGLLVESVSIVETQANASPKTSDYATPSTAADDWNPQELAAACLWSYSIGMLLVALGLISFFAAVVSFFTAMAMSHDNKPYEQYVAAAGASIVGGVVFLAFGTLMRVLAGIGQGIVRIVSNAGK